MLRFRYLDQVEERDVPVRRAVKVQMVIHGNKQNYVRDTSGAWTRRVSILAPDGSVREERLALTAADAADALDTAVLHWISGNGEFQLLVEDN